MEENGVMEYWSAGKEKIVFLWSDSFLHYSNTPSLQQYFSTPLLQYSSPPVFQYPITPSLHYSAPPLPKSV
jgi:hypothetical protein